MKGCSSCGGGQTPKKENGSKEEIQYNKVEVTLFKDDKEVQKVTVTFPAVKSSTKKELMSKIEDVADNLLR